LVSLDTKVLGAKLGIVLTLAMTVRLSAVCWQLQAYLKAKLVG